jgi:hypothetical protein
MDACYLNHGGPVPTCQAKPRFPRGTDPGTQTGRYRARGRSNTIPIAGSGFAHRITKVRTSG